MAGGRCVLRSNGRFSVPFLQRGRRRRDRARLDATHAGHRTYRRSPTTSTARSCLQTREAPSQRRHTRFIPALTRPVLLNPVPRQPRHDSAVRIGSQREGATPSKRARRGVSHQFERPSSVTRAGTSRARTTVASSAMPAARPVAKILSSVAGPAASATKAKTRMSAALVTSRPVAARPSTTARSVSPFSSYDSRMRLRMKTS